MRTNSLQVPLHWIALKTHTKTLATFFIENQGILKNELVFDTSKIEAMAQAIQPFIKSIVDIWKENETLISTRLNHKYLFNDEVESPLLYPQSDRRYQRTDLQIKLIK